MSPQSPQNFLMYIMLLLVFSCSNDIDLDQELERPDDIPYAYTVLEQEVSLLVNSHRERLGLSTLIMLNESSLQSQKQSDHMLAFKHMCHDNFSERYDYLVASVDASRVGENTAFGFETASSVVNNWLKSYTHKNIIEDPLFTHFGISIKKGADSNNYFCQIFVRLPE
ncbi:MAG: CAP domain-containing protein [Flavobacteriaceae bacterium]|nr:CAP domain-containing protein [Flavobacteriaceae bacterium]